MIRLGKRGYRSIMVNLTRTADYLAASLQHLGFLVMSEGRGKGLPLVAFRLDPGREGEHDEFALAHLLRERGWVVPAYTMAPHSEKLKLMRIVVREDFSRSRCDILVNDIKMAMSQLAEMDRKTVEQRQQCVSPITAPIIYILYLYSYTTDESTDHLVQERSPTCHQLGQSVAQPCPLQGQ